MCPISQKPCTFPLKQADWVQKELETLEKTSAIVKSVPPWERPIVVVKKIAPGEPPRRHLCIHYKSLK